MGRPATACMALGRALFMRVPRPAARMMAAAGMLSPGIGAVGAAQAPFRRRFRL